ncbi:helix-turn-helix transcriptional regulator [Nocardia vaccinii]|uniref:helix-turn-helix transcriptional regulator n=1 Tax=Nocardia vaccinii TaxID=1822 RepID=UPI0008346B87|nr:helix-turn-helix domain-containing protein [Nocardia vaccinii]
MSPSPADPVGRTARTHGRRADVLSALRAAREPLSILDLSTRLGLHANTVRFHLDALVSAGQAEHVRPERTGPGRPAQMLRAHRGMDPTGPRNYQLLARILLAELENASDPAAHALRAGRAWGRRLPPPDTGKSATDVLLSTLAELGFDPRLDSADRERILLRHCPFLDLVEDRPALVCAVHLGLMRGVLDARRASVTVDRLDAFARPDLCLAHLTTTGGEYPAAEQTGHIP